jgi:hypothetical protein
MSNDEDDKVGYGKPPKHSQFKKGQSGNPKGRRKSADKPLDLNAALTKEFLAKVTVTDHRGTRKITKFDATITQLANKAASGHLPSLRLLMPWLTQVMKDNPARGSASVNIQDVRKRIMERMELLARRAREQDEETKRGEGDASGREPRNLP